MRTHSRRGPATQGDVRSLADLFGLSIQAGTRYIATVDHPDLTNQSDTAERRASP